MVNNNSNNEEKNKRLHDKDFRSIGSPTAKTSNLLTVSFQNQPDLNKKGIKYGRNQGRRF
jgi:hypothetical protein